MSSARLDSIRVERLKFSRLFSERATMATAAATVLADDCASLLFIDPNGAGRNVTLPVEANSDGRVLIIVNTADAAETLTLLGSAGGALSPAGAIAQNKASILVCDGTAWRFVLTA